MKMQTAITRTLIAAVAFAFCGVPELAQAWQQPAQPQQNQTPPAINGTTVNPSQGPLTPAPEGPQPQQNAPANQPAPSTPSTQMTQQPQTSTEPLGTAGAEGIPTSGGGASRPAGTAIAPAKQHQTRSLFLKLGAIAAAGIAVGAVAGLSKGTSSAPSGPRASSAARQR